MRLSNLDLIRSFACLMVLVDHLRYFMVSDNNAKFFDKLMFVFAGSGPQFLWLFFVLSGFFIGGSVYEAMKKQKWHWGVFLINRLVRLWVVLLPCLLLTLLLDRVGQQFDVAGYYQGKMAEVYRAQYIPVLALDWRTFLGNMFFVQDFLVKIYGTNHSLWTLSVEFWWYILFPLGLFAVIGAKNWGWRLLHLALLVFLLFWLPRNWILLGVLWLLGYAVYMVNKQQKLFPIFRSRWYILLTTALYAAMVFLSRFNYIKGYTGAVLVSIASCFAILWFLQFPIEQPLLVKSSKFISDISYTFYLLHYPLMGFVFTVFFQNRQFEPSALTWLLFVIFLLCTLFISWLLYLLIEQHTPFVRRKALALFGL